MRPSLFNVAVPRLDQGDVFLMNTWTDAQAVVSPGVTDLLDRLDRDPTTPTSLTPAERDALSELTGAGFVVGDHEAERAAVRDHFAAFTEDTSDLRVTVLTTLQCNFACDYCVQGDHAAFRDPGHRMSAEAVARTLDWIGARLDAVAPRRFVLTFFGGEPLLNLPAVYALAEGAWHACRARGVEMLVNVITNGLLLTPEVVDRLLPFGLNGVKITLDGDRAQHDRQRPLRGGQGTFDRIVENVRQVAGRCKVAIGGNFDVESAGSFEALLDYLAAQDFAPLLDKVNFKPVIRPLAPATPKGIIPLVPVGPDGGARVASGRQAAAPAPSSPCDTCHFVDEQMSALREATKARGFRTLDGIHMGPCELHRRHAYTIGPDGALYACPGFASDGALAVGHIDGRAEPRFAGATDRFAGLTPWREACGDCAFVPVCGGGCSVAAHTELGDLHAPSCHKTSFESAVASLARNTSSAVTSPERSLI